MWLTVLVGSDQSCVCRSVQPEKIFMGSHKNDIVFAHMYYKPGNGNKLFNCKIIRWCKHDSKTWWDPMNITEKIFSYLVIFQSVWFSIWASRKFGQTQLRWRIPTCSIWYFQDFRLNLSPTPLYWTNIFLWFTYLWTEVRHEGCIHIVWTFTINAGLLQSSLVWPTAD